MANTEGVPPASDIPAIWGDYNAVGLSGEEGDDCIYSLHRDRLSELGPEEGLVIFVYEDDVDDDGNPEVFGFVCALERVEWATGGWRARPVSGTWYRGPKTWLSETVPSS